MSTKEFLNFLSIAQGSPSEVETELLISMRLGFCSVDVHRELSDNLDEIGRMITGLYNHLSVKLTS